MRVTRLAAAAAGVGILLGPFTNTWTRVTTDLGALDGGRQTAFGMNDAGDAVGMAEGRDGALRAVLFRGGVAVDLNDRIDPAAGWRLTEARDINARGQIAGTGWLHGRQRAYLLTPARWR